MANSINILGLVSHEKRGALMKEASERKKARKVDSFKRANSGFHRDNQKQKDSDIKGLAGKLLPNGLLDSKTIVANSEVYEKNIGVYFLILKGVIVYIGQSIDIQSRVGAHYGVLDFDSYSYIECAKSDLDLVESIYIHIYSPPLNGITSTGQCIAPLSPNTLRKMVEQR